MIMGIRPDQYKEIADGDPGGALIDAYNVMTAETDGPAVKKMTYLDVANEASYEVATELETAIKTAIQNGAPSWIDTALAGEGIDINNLQTIAQLQEFNALALISNEALAAIESLQTTLPKYPALTSPQILQNARDQRAKGAI